MITDLLAQFSWGEFALAATLYTLLPFLSLARSFNAANAKSTMQLIVRLKSEPKRVLGIHAGFLILLFAILWGSASFLFILSKLDERARGF